MTATFTLHPGTQPLLISMPHVGTRIPAEQHEQLVPRALACEDTDWHLEQLYGGIARALGASLLVPRHSRYLIDLNRPPDDTPMYPGAANTELCPTRFFTGEALYQAGCAPDAAQIAQRRARYWQPYHQALQHELTRLHRQHGRVVLFEAHSIRSELPWLFAGRLPDLSIGTVGGTSCDPAMRALVHALLTAQQARSWVLDGRFKGGYITRHYGRPDSGWHALQLEMCQCLYMDEAPPFAYQPALAEQLQPLLRALLGALLDWATRP